jgi:hypothetical protein
MPDQKLFCYAYKDSKSRNARAKKIIDMCGPDRIMVSYGLNGESERLSPEDSRLITEELKKLSELSG